MVSAKSISKKLLPQSTDYSNQIDILLENVADMSLKRRAKIVIQELNPKPGDRILDAGCGDGFYLHLLSGLNSKLNLTGTDIDQNALKSATRNLKGRSIKLIQADLMQGLPFKPNSFDKVLLSEVLEHLPDDLKGLKEIKRVLKKGGVMVITVPNKNYPFLWDPLNWILEHFIGIHIRSGFFAGIWNQHVRLYSLKQLLSRVEKVGFKALRRETLTSWCLPFNHYILNIGARMLLNKNVSSQAVQSANKFSKNIKKPVLISIFFYLVNTIDKLNDNVFSENGVSVLLSAKK